MGWVMLFFSANGRIERKAFWIAWLVIAAMAGVLRLFGPLGALLGLACIYPQVCLYSKRLHDIGQTGWKILIPLGLMVAAAVLAGIGEALDHSPAVLIADLPSVGLSIASVVTFLRVTFEKGEPDENRYGPPPGGMLPDRQPAHSPGSA